MIQQRHPILLALVATALCLGVDAYAAPAKTAKPAKSAEAAKPTGTPVEYQDLEGQVGAVIVVETNLGTARRGTLVKWTNPTLVIKLGPEAGSIDLSVPHDAVRHITLVEPAPAAASTPPATQGSGSAKKN